MNNISINSDKTQTVVLKLIKTIQIKITDASQNSYEKIIGAIEQSKGDFIDSLKEEVAQEATIMASVGELLILVVKYIQLAADTFASVDYGYVCKLVESLVLSLWH